MNGRFKNGSVTKWIRNIYKTLLWLRIFLIYKGPIVKLSYLFPMMKAMVLAETLGF